jgi:hypothetical protein
MTHPQAAEPGYRVGPLDQQEGIGEQDVLDLWARERAFPPEEGKRRIHEVLMVATDGRGPAGVSTVHLHRPESLRLDLWYFRVFVAAAHRKGNLAVMLARATRDHLQERFVTRQDTRGAGIAAEVQHEGLQSHLDDAVWPRTGLAFIGETNLGDHLRVRYFPGALAPEPPR